MKNLLLSASITAMFALLSGCATVTGGKLVSGNAPVGEIAVVNQTNIAINAVTISKCSAMSHGFNRLSAPIQPGGGMRFRVDQGCWHVVAGAGHGDGVSYSMTRTATLEVAGGQRRVFRVGGTVNR